jgi:hypothetical protein
LAWHVLRVIGAARGGLEFELEIPPGLLRLWQWRMLPPSSGVGLPSLGAAWWLGHLLLLQVAHRGDHRFLL